LLRQVVNLGERERQPSVGTTRCAGSAIVVARTGTEMLSIRRHPSLLLCFFPDSLQGTRESHSVKQRNCPCLPVAVGVAELDVDQALVRSVAREKHHSFKRIKH